MIEALVDQKKEEKLQIEKEKLSKPEPEEKKAK